MSGCRFRFAPRVRLELVRDEKCVYYSQPIWYAVDVFRLFAEDARTWERERVIAVLLDSNRRIIGVDETAVGSDSAALLHPKDVFKSAVLANASGIILVHNHSDGDPNPSLNEREVNRRLRASSVILGIPLLDHVILGTDSFYSFSDEMGL